MDEKKPVDPVRAGVGLRLKAAREVAGYTQPEVGRIFGIGKGAVSAWEVGTSDPGVYRLRELSKLYGVSTDAILWENSLTPDAMKLAAEFDSLSEKQKNTLRALWMAFIQVSASDGDIEKAMPITVPIKYIQG